MTSSFVGMVVASAARFILGGRGLLTFRFRPLAEGPAPRESALEGVPVRHLAFAPLPAQVREGVLDVRREVDEAGMDVLELAACRGDLVDVLVEEGAGLVAFPDQA